MITALLVILAAMSAPARTAIHLATEATVKQLDGCVNTFGLEHGRYPSQGEGLSLLVTGPPEEKGKNPGYIRAVPKDPWDRDYVYRFPSLHNPEGPDIYSLGEDGISKTGGNDADDINNWNRTRPWAAYYNWRYQPFWYRHSNWLIGRPWRVFLGCLVQAPSAHHRVTAGITGEDMQHFTWLKPTTKVKVVFREWTSWGRLRHPTFSPAGHNPKPSCAWRPSRPA